MKRTIPFLLLITALSALSGYLMSKASWIGRVGITFLHREYNLLKIWWQGGLAVLLVMILFFILQSFIENKLPYWLAKFLHIVLLLAAVCCLYLTYDDFTTDFSHHLLGKRFHMGFYLAWAEWMLICIYFMFMPRKKTTIVTNKDKKETVTP